NYKGPKVRLFSFPRDVKRRTEWQRAVRRRDVDVGLLKDPKVSCIQLLEHLGAWVKAQFNVRQLIEDAGRRQAYPGKDGISQTIK
ncbi:hypothetical protein HPB47_005883, partial [Ixodes persulcatus]